MAKKSCPCRPYVAEALSVLCLTLGVSLSVVSGSAVATPIVAALVVAMFVYTIGPVSGAHINPAVTVGLWSVGKISVKDAVLYIVSQFVGAWLAMQLTGYFTGSHAAVVAGEPSAVTVAAEAAGAFILVFGIAAVVYGKVKDAASGIVIGGSLLVGILIASVASNGVLNPAVAYGIGSLSSCYVLGPVIGGVAGAWAGRYLHG